MNECPGQALLGLGYSYNTYLWYIVYPMQHYSAVVCILPSPAPLPPLDPRPEQNGPEVFAAGRPMHIAALIDGCPFHASCS